jgi:hypothetical protein
MAFLQILDEGVFFISPPIIHIIVRDAQRIPEVRWHELPHISKHDSLHCVSAGLAYQRLHSQHLGNILYRSGATLRDLGVATDG